MNLLNRLSLVLCTILAVPLAQGQVISNSRMPPVVDMTRNGWDVTMQNGNLTLGFPLANIPGEVPIPVNFGMNGTYLAKIFQGRYRDPSDGSFYAYRDEIDRPVAGGVHFGYISTSSTYDHVTIPGLTVLENGTQIADSDWTLFGSHANLGTILNLPQAFGFTAVSTGTAKVDPTATYLSYSTTASGLGATYQPIVQGLPPAGFGALSTNYMVVMDRDKARVYAYASSVSTWVPVLWADRFNHYVKFEWSRSTTGLPGGVSAISQVKATNQRSKGVVLRWAEWPFTPNQPVVDILRLDYVGMVAPSILVQGYPGPAGMAPSGFVDTLAPLAQFFVVPSIIGSVCRPRYLKVGAYGAIPQPSWSGVGGIAQPPAPGPDPVATPAPSATQTWTFNYDANQAELTSYTDPRGLTNTFTYANYPSCVRGVSQVDAVDASLNKRSMRWTRTFPSGTSPLTVKVEGWWDPTKLPNNPDRYHQIVFPTDTLTYGNGVYQVDTLKDTSGKIWRNTTYAYNSAGAGLNASLSRVQSVSVQEDGAPTITTAMGYYPDGTNLQVTGINVTATDASGVVHQVSNTVNSYGTRWDMLEGHQLSQVVTTRYKPDGTALPAITQVNVYDQATLQLKQTYQDGGSTGRHGTIYTYDSGGRFNTQSIYHVEGAATLTTPNLLTMGYEAASGMPISSSVQDKINPTAALIQTQGAFDSSGRATVQTDSTGVTTSYTFDDRGRPLSVSRPGAPTTTYSYPSELTVNVAVNGQTATSTYDGFGLLRQKTIPTGILATNGTTQTTTQTPTYDLYGRQIALTEVNPAGTSRTQAWGYDALDRVISATPLVGGGRTIRYVASGMNRKVTTTLSNQVSSSTVIDPFGQTVEMDAPDGSVTKATYDEGGRQILLTIQPGAGSGPLQQRSWTYDALGRCTSKNEPETNTQVFTGFNALSQPTAMTEASGTGDARTRTLSYDGFGRMVSMVSGSDSLTNAYTGPNLTSATRTVGGVTVTQAFTYNGPGGLMDSETTAQPNLTTLISYGYDAIGRLLRLTYPDSRVIGYGYDALSRVTSITNQGAALVSFIKFDDWGNRWQTAFASGAQDQWDADLSGTRLKNWNIGYVGGGPTGRAYTYDDATNILKTAGEWTLTHDNLGRLSEADGFGITTAHASDAYGNSILHTASANGSAVPVTFRNYTFDPLVNNQIPGLTKTGATTGWNTNLRGEATVAGVAALDGTTSVGLGWDGLGVVKSASWATGNQTYLYAPSGMRVSLTDAYASANNRKYAYTASGLLLGEYKASTTAPTWNRDVIYLGSEAIAEIDASGIHELHNDHLGSPRFMTKGTGTWGSSLIGTADGTQAFGPYGEQVSRTGYLALTGYTGHLQTDASGLIYMRGRYYSPAWHRFVNSDQGVDPRSLNQFTYVGGRTLGWKDPTGMTATYLNGFPIEASLLSAILSLYSDSPAVQGAKKDEQGWSQTNQSGFSDDGSSISVSGGQAWNPKTQRWEDVALPGPPQTNSSWLSDTWNKLTFGSFRFGGAEADGAEAGGFHGVIHEYDNKTGHTTGLLSEGWLGGEGAAVGAGKITMPGDLFGGWFGFLGGSLSLGPITGGQVGIAAGSNWVGVYWEGHAGPGAVGGGGYLRW